MNIDRTRLFDKRVVQRNIRAGRVTKDEFGAWLRDLDDSEEKIKARDEGGDDDDYEPNKPAAPGDEAEGIADPFLADPGMDAVPGTPVAVPSAYPADAAPAQVAPAQAAPYPAAPPPAAPYP
nr:hypothetical protein [Deltaproteobacteria bacterium]